MADWNAALKEWLKPFVEQPGHIKRRQMCPLYVPGLIGPGECKSIEPMAARIALNHYDRLHHFISDGMWDTGPIEAELARQTDRCGQSGKDAVLNCKQRVTSSVPRIFGGEKEARLIALACSQLPKGRAEWTLRLLETQGVELNIVDHASDNMIGRVLRKWAQASSRAAMGHTAASKQPIRSGDGGYCGRVQAATRRRLSAGLSG